MLRWALKPTLGITHNHNQSAAQITQTSSIPRVLFAAKKRRAEWNGENKQLQNIFNLNAKARPDDVIPNVPDFWTGFA